MENDKIDWDDKPPAEAGANKTSADKSAAKRRPASDSISNCLKANDVALSAVKANKLLLSIGILEEKERPSGKDPSKMKKFKVLTEKGLAFGFNKDNISNPAETSPAYYKEEFPKLAELIIAAQE